MAWQGNKSGWTSLPAIELVVLTFGFFVTVASGQAAGPQVVTQYGGILGIYADEAAIFYGVPYAADPVGELRWQAPQEVKPWGNTVLNATSPRPACPQFDCQRLSPPLVCPKETSEACLHLDIFTPRAAILNTSANSYPVMVYIHGGNFVHMASSSPLFDGRRLITRHVIYVSINYRLGAMGFLVTGKTSFDAQGNYGILDHQMALRWVQKNIGAFGGDPNQVTLFGQSAGAQSSLLHLTLPSSAPLFNRVIIESSPLAIPYKRFPEAIVLGALFAELLGCVPRDVPCLRSKSAQDIVYAQYLARSKVSSLKLLELFEPWGPFVDGQLIEAEPLPMIQAGRFSSKEIMMGTTSEETVLYIYSAWNASVDDVKYGEVVLATYPDHAVKIMYMYPPAYPRDERDTMVRLSTDLVFACSTRNASRNILTKMDNVYLYVWDHAFSFPGWGPVFFCEGRVCHGSEIVYLFQTQWQGNFTFTADEQVLSEQLQIYWTNFAKSGNPNQPTVQQLQWPKYNKAEDWPNLWFKTPSSAVDTDYHAPFCDFWDNIGYSA